MAAHRRGNPRAAQLQARRVPPHPAGPLQVRPQGRPARQARRRTAAALLAGLLHRPPELIAEIFDAHFVCHLPYYRQPEIFARGGARFDRKSLCDWVAPCTLLQVNRHLSEALET